MCILQVDRSHIILLTVQDKKKKNIEETQVNYVNQIHPRPSECENWNREIGDTEINCLPIEGRKVSRSLPKNQIRILSYDNFLTHDFQTITALKFLLNDHTCAIRTYFEYGYLSLRVRFNSWIRAQLSSKYISRSERLG